MTDILVRKLDVHDYFGEVSLVYDSVRTATVTSKNYCTLGKLHLNVLYDVCLNFPFFKQALMKHIY